MARKFSKCLSKPRKLYNCSIGSLILGGGCLVLCGIGFGLLYGVGFGVTGFMMGGYLDKEWHRGTLQKLLYHYLPYASIWLDPNIPDSSNIYEL